MPINTIDEIVSELRAGRMVVVLDDEDRENEGDLLIAAQFVRPEDINFMAGYGRGLICLALTPERCRQLQLPLMVDEPRARNRTRFTVSIEAAVGVTTGISAADRARTVQAAVRKDARPSDLVTPGHIFPLMAQRGGVLARAGHTEAGVDLARLAGLEPACVVCEIMNEDGTMARRPELERFAQQHGLKIGTIADLIRYRMETESTIERKSECAVPTEFGEFRLVAYHDTISERTHLALVKGSVAGERPVLVRVHVQESLCDLFTDAHRAGHWTIYAALQRIAAEDAGVVVVLDDPESSEQLVARVERLAREEARSEAPPTIRAREELRSYGLGCQILADLGVRKLRVLGRPMRIPALSGFGLEIAEYLERGALHPTKGRSRPRSA